MSEGGTALSTLRAGPKALVLQVRAALEGQEKKGEGHHAGLKTQQPPTVQTPVSPHL